LKDQRAIWVLVATLRLRDETTPERQAELEQLRQAATLAMRKIGDPLAGKPAANLSSQAAPEEANIEEQPEVHPRLAGDLGALSELELVSVLKEIAASSEEISWANLERREPLLPAYFRSYEQRQRAAEMIGAELHRRGGTALLNRIVEQELGDNAAIRNWWVGLKQSQAQDR